MYCREICDTNGNTKYEYKGININLNDFTKIDIKDIFINSKIGVFVIIYSFLMKILRFFLILFIIFVKNVKIKL